jgi:uncharacterized membrane protein
MATDIRNRSLAGSETMTESESPSPREMRPDELEVDDLIWNRRREMKESVEILLSHHPPSLYGHCLRLSLRGHSLYFCGRCTGIYGGLALGLVILLVMNVRLEPSWAWFFAAVAVGFATVIDWSTQRLTPRKTTVQVRAVTGLMSGLSLAVIFGTANILYMLIALGIMMGTIGIVTVIEDRMKSAASIP